MATAPNPSIKDEEAYERLRDDGASKEKAARISNAMAAEGGSAAGRGGEKSPAFEEWSKRDLYERARNLGVQAAPA